MGTWLAQYSPEQIEAFATLVYAGVTICTLIAIVAQIRVAREQTGKMQSQLEQATRAAEAAKRGADGLTNIERAWLMLAEIKPTFSIFHNSFIEVTVRFQNCGRTPAWIVDAGFGFRKSYDVNLQGVKEGGYSYKPQIIHEPVPPGRRSNKFSIVLEGAHPLSVEGFGRLNDAEISELEANDLFLYLFGFIKYREVFFQETKELRELYFFMRYDKSDPFSWVYAGGPEANRYT